MSNRSRSTTRWFGRTWLVVASVLALGALGACGGSGTKTVADVSATSSSSSSSSDGETATAGDPGSGGGRLDSTTLLAAMKQAVAPGQTVHMAMLLDSGSAASSIESEGDIEYAAKGINAVLSMHLGGSGGRAVEMRMVDGVIYMSMPPLTPKGKFLKLDPKDASSPLGDSFSGLAGQIDPMGSFDAWEKGLTGLEYVGEDPIDGDQFEHYTVTVNSAEVAKATGQKIPAGTPKESTYDLWIGSDDLMRRMTFDVAGMTTQMDLTRWGEPVTVVKPAAKDVVSMGAGMGG